MSAVDESLELGGVAEELEEHVQSEPGRRLDEPDGRPVAAERPLRRALADAGRDRIPDDVQDPRYEMRLALHLDDGRTVVEEMRGPHVLAAHATRVRAVHQLK